MYARPQPDRGRRGHNAVFVFASGLFTILLSLFMLYVFSRTTTAVPATGDHTEHDEQPSPVAATTTETPVDHFTPIPTPTVEPEVRPDPVQENGFVLSPKDHIDREPQTLRLTWNVTRELREPDGVEKQVYLINGRRTRATALIGR